jgi:hypothetical protein
MTTRAEAYAMYKDEYLAMDGVEQVTISSVDNAALNVATAKAKRLPLTQASVPLGGMDGLVRKRGRKWILFTTTLGGNVPTDGWRLTTAAGEQWTVDGTIQEARWGTQYIVDMVKAANT